MPGLARSAGEYPTLGTQGLPHGFPLFDGGGGTAVDGEEFPVLGWIEEGEAVAGDIVRYALAGIKEKGNIEGWSAFKFLFLAFFVFDYGVNVGYAW